MHFSPKHSRHHFLKHAHTISTCFSVSSTASEISEYIRRSDCTLPDSIKHRLWGLPFSTSVTRSLRKARRSTYTVEASGFEALCSSTHHTDALCSSTHHTDMFNYSARSYALPSTWTHSNTTLWCILNGLLPKVNRFGWNLESCQPNVGGWPWQTLATIRTVATVWEGAEKMFVFWSGK